MNNYKFRGKTAEGKWVYGYLIYSDEKFAAMAAKERDRADSLIRQNEAIEVYINDQKNSNTQTQSQKMTAQISF